VLYFLYIFHVLLCLFLILVVLLQQGKGADLSVFGGGSTMTAFGARSATTLLHRLTVGAFVGFVLTTISIAYLQAHGSGSSLMRGADKAVPVSAPAQTPAAAPAAATPVEQPAAGQPAAEPAAGATEGSPAAPAPGGETPAAPPSN